MLRPEDCYTKIGLAFRVTDTYGYWVTGHGIFPYDMLRYDCAWPADGGAARNLDRPSTSEEYKQLRSIRLHSITPPAIDRWSSFGWSVSRHSLKES